MEERSILLAELLPVIQDVLAAGGEFSLKPRGESMLPYFREGRDTVMLSTVSGRIKPGDILLYVRQTGVPVLHRVVSVDTDGSFTMRGDSQYFIERGIRPEQVVAIVKRFYRRGREKHTDSLSSRLYCARRKFTYPIRHFTRRAVSRLKRILKGGKQHG